MSRVAFRVTSKPFFLTSFPWFLDFRSFPLAFWLGFLRVRGRMPVLRPRLGTLTRVAGSPVPIKLSINTLVHSFRDRDKRTNSIIPQTHQDLSRGQVDKQEIHGEINRDGTRIKLKRAWLKSERGPDKQNCASCWEREYGPKTVCKLLTISLTWQSKFSLMLFAGTEVALTEEWSVWEIIDDKGNEFWIRCIPLISQRLNFF